MGFLESICAHKVLMFDGIVLLPCAIGVLFQGDLPLSLGMLLLAVSALWAASMSSLSHRSLRLLVFTLFLLSTTTTVVQAVRLDRSDWMRITDLNSIVAIVNFTSFAVVAVLNLAFLCLADSGRDHTPRQIQTARRRMNEAQRKDE